MAKNKFRFDDQDGFQAAIHGIFDWFSAPENKKNRQFILTLVLVAVVGLVAYGYTKQQQKGLESSWKEEIGQAMALSAQGKSQEAKELYRTFLANPSVTGLYQAKAALMLGDIYYYEGNYPAAKEQFEIAQASASGSDLILSGAEHGLAAILIQEKKYSEAVSALETFVSKWGLRTEPVIENYTGKEDKVFQVPEAYVQLALSYVELGQKEKANQALEKILSIYPDSRQASMARKVQSTL